MSAEDVDKVYRQFWALQRLHQLGMIYYEKALLFVLHEVVQNNETTRNGRTRDGKCNEIC